MPFLCTGIFFYLLVFVLLPLQENISGFKMLQPVPAWFYWLITYLFDAIFHICVISLLMLEHKAFNKGNDYFHTEEYSKLFSNYTYWSMPFYHLISRVDSLYVIYLLHGLVYLCFIYMMSLLMKSKIGVFACIIVLNIISGTYIRLPSHTKYMYIYIYLLISSSSQYGWRIRAVFSGCRKNVTCINAFARLLSV